MERIMGAAVAAWLVLSVLVVPVYADHFWGFQVPTYADGVGDSPVMPD